MIAPILIGLIAMAPGSQGAATTKDMAYRVVKVVGKAYFVVGIKPERRVVVGPISSAASIRCEPGASVEILKLGAKKPEVFNSTKLAPVRKPSDRSATRDRLLFAFEGLYEIGGSTRRGEIANMIFPLAGTVRPKFAFVLLPEGASTPDKTELIVRYLQSDWKMGEVLFTSTGIQARLNEHLVDFQKDVAGAILEITMVSGGKKFSSAPFSLLPQDTCAEVGKDLAEVDSLYGNDLSAPKCVVRAGVLNSYGLRTEAAVELEMALGIDPNQRDLYVPLALIYLQGGALDLMNDTIERLSGLR